MENIINTFYKGNINKFGFGGWNTTKNNMKEILGEYPYPSNIGNQIDKYFQKNNIDQESNKNIRRNYIPTIYSKISSPQDRADFSEANAMNLKPISLSQYQNFDNHGFQNTQIKTVPNENFSPALIRMEYLEKKMNDLEYKTRLEMKKSLNDINERYIDPRFKKFLDDNQGKYDVFGNDPDPLDERRNYVKNNLGNMKLKMENDEINEHKKKKNKVKKQKKKRKKKLFEDSEIIEEKSEEGEKDGGTVPEENNNIPDTPLRLIQNINNLPKRTTVPDTPIKKLSSYISPTKPSKGLTKINSVTKRLSQKGTKKASVRNSVFGSVRGSMPISKRASVRGSVVNSPRKGSIYSRRSSLKMKEEEQIEKVLGDIGYTFEGKTNKEKELQFQTNRIGKDFDRLLHEMKNFKKTIKEKLRVQNNDENIKLNALKEIFLLDNKEIMKHAVDKTFNKKKEPFDANQYKKKIDNERLEEINNLISKKLEEYDDDLDKYNYYYKIYKENQQMINNNIINKYEYQKYMQKRNNKIITLPNIYIKPSQNLNSNQNEERTNNKKRKIEKKAKRNKNNNIISTSQSTEDYISINNNEEFKKIKEETIHFGDTVKDDSEFLSKSSKILPPLNDNNMEDNKNQELKSDKWLSDNEGENKNPEEIKENKENEEKKTKTNSKKTENKNKTESKKNSESNENKSKYENEEKEKDDENSSEDEYGDEENEDSNEEEKKEKKESEKSEEKKNENEEDEEESEEEKEKSEKKDKKSNEDKKEESGEGSEEDYEEDSEEDYGEDSEEEKESKKNDKKSKKENKEEAPKSESKTKNKNNEENDDSENDNDEDDEDKDD